MKWSHLSRVIRPLNPIQDSRSPSLSTSSLSARLTLLMPHAGFIRRRRVCVCGVLVGWVVVCVCVWVVCVRERDREMFLTEANAVCPLDIHKHRDTYRVPFQVLPDGPQMRWI